MFAKINNTAYITRKNINSRNIFIKKRRQNDDASLARRFIKYSIFNVLKNRRRKEKLKL